MKTIEIEDIPSKMKEEASKLGKGEIIVAFEDKGKIYIELTHSSVQYFWRQGQWHEQQD